GRGRGAAAASTARTGGPWWVGGEDPEVVGGVEGGELADDGPGEGAGPVRGAGQGQNAESPKPDRDRGTGKPGGATDELLRGLEELGVVLGEGVAVGVEPGRGGQGNGAAPDPDGEEVGVGGAALPEAVRVGDGPQELWWVGVEVVGDGELS